MAEAHDRQAAASAGDAGTTFDLSGKVVVVTGAARGLGQALSADLGRFGASLVLLDREEDAVRRVAEALGDGRTEAIGIACDVTDPAAAAGAVDEAVRTFGRIDGLVNNAGVNRIGASESIDPGEWEQVIRVNLFGAFVMSQQVGRRMLEAETGSIVNMTSIHAHVGPALHPASAYSASKSGLLGLTRALAAEWGPRGVRVNAVSPGFIRTEMTRARLDDPAYAAGILERSPLRRVGEPRDLTGALVYLLSDLSRMVTGQAIAVDAGWLAI